MEYGPGWTRPAYLEASRAPQVDGAGQPLPRAIVESEGVCSIPSRGRLNQPLPHSDRTSFERTRHAQLRFHNEAAGESVPGSSQPIVRTQMNQSRGVMSAMHGGPAPSGYGPERGVLGSGSSAKRGLGAEHYKTHMDSSATGALLTWEDVPSSGRPGTAPARDNAAAKPAYGHKGRGPRYAREMLAGTGAAKGTGFYSGVASYYESTDTSGRPEPTSTAAEVHEAAHKGRGPRYAREALAGRGAAIETGFYPDVARYWGSDDSKASSPAGGDGTAGRATVAATHNRKGQYASRELVGSGAASELPGPVVSARTAITTGSRPAVWNRRDLSVRDAEAAAKGVVRSHWETESASMMGGHRAGWRDPLQGAVPVRTGRKPSAQAQHDRFKPTSLW